MFHVIPQYPLNTNSSPLGIQPWGLFLPNPRPPQRRKHHDLAHPYHRRRTTNQTRSTPRAGGGAAAERGTIDHGGKGVSGAATNKLLRALDESTQSTPKCT